MNSNSKPYKTSKVVFGCCCCRRLMHHFHLLFFVFIYTVRSYLMFLHIWLTCVLFVIFCLWHSIEVRYQVLFMFCIIISSVATTLIQEKYEEATAALADMEKRVIMAESMLEATLQYQSGQLKAQPSPRWVEFFTMSQVYLLEKKTFSTTLCFEFQLCVQRKVIRGILKHG